MRARVTKLPYTFGKGLMIDILRKQNMEEALQLATQIYCKDEPLVRHLKVPPKTFFDWLWDYQEHSNNPMLTVAVQNDKGKVVACFVNSELDIHPATAPHGRTLPPPLSQLLMEAEEEYRKYYKQKQLQGRILSLGMAAVDEQCRGQNVYRHLVYASCVNGKQHGFKRVMTEDTNKFSAEPDLKMGLTPVKFLRYDDWVFKDDTGESRPFKGVNESYTDYWNNLQIGKKRLVNIAEGLLLLDGDIETIMTRCHELGI